MALDGGDDFNDGRDSRGRFRKGCSGNPFGRPRKKAALSEADPFVFAQSLIKLGSGDQVIEMTRREAVQKKMFELAMKGSVKALIELRKEWARMDEMRAHARIRLEALEREWLIEKRGKDIPDDVELEIMGLRSALNMGEMPNPWRNDPEKRRRFQEILRSAASHGGTEPP